MPKPLPVCKNRTCPRYRTNIEVIVLQETQADATFGCRACGGIEVRTTDWRRAEQQRYENINNPEYARKRRMFFLGRNSHIGG